MVPFGGRAAKLLQRYLYYFRAEPVIVDRFFLCLDGTSMSENTIKLIFARLAKKAGVPRLHIHLLRHTFATRYLMNGGDAFSLQRILGHSTLEMTRRYVDTVAMEAPPTWISVESTCAGRIDGSRVKTTELTTNHQDAETPSCITLPAVPR